MLTDCPRRREIVLPHHVYSGVLQVSFRPSRHEVIMGTGTRAILVIRFF